MEMARLSSVFVNIDRCVGCGLCAKVCLRNLIVIIEIDGAAKAGIARSDRCAACGNCSLICPTGAIEVYE